MPARDTSSDAAFREYVEGKTIAIVGPAPLDGDQMPEIEAHDLVYVVNAQWRTHNIRADMAFLNGGFSREYNRGMNVAYQVDWVVLKNRQPARECSRQAHSVRGYNVNQVVGALYDLSIYSPADVKVYGADFYIGGPAKTYLKQVKTMFYKDGRPSVETMEAGIRSHEQDKQRETVRSIIKAKGWPSGDSRYVSIAQMTNEEYRAAYTAAWRHPDAAKQWAAA